MKLPVATLLADLIPAIRFEKRDHFLDFRRHRFESVLFLPGGSLACNQPRKSAFGACACSHCSSIISTHTISP